MLAILWLSSVWALRKCFTSGKGNALQTTASPVVDINKAVLMRLAVPQGILAVMALTSYHVQIVNRICSGYPVWYWYLASLVTDDSVQPKDKSRRSQAFTIVVHVSVAYGLIQGVLFGSFLPPA